VKILQEIDNPLLTYHLHPVPVITFNDKSTKIEIDNIELKGIALPYTSSTSAEGRLTDDIERLEEGDILITSFPEDIDDAKFILIRAVQRGAGGIVFADRVNAHRRVVVSIDEEYTYSTGSLIKVPVIAVSRETGETLRKHVGKIVRIETEVDYRWSIGYNIEIVLTEAERNLLITAHFDHWMTGMLDNSLGVGTVLSLIDDILTSARIGVRIVLFTAEEFGVPNLASMYWTWGSKSFSEYLISNKMIDTIMFVLNVDVVGKKPYMYTTEDIYRQFNILDMEQSVPYFDTLNFETLGIPCITVSCLKECWDIYHTELENEKNIDLSYLAYTIDAVFNIFRKLNENRLKIDYSIYLDRVRQNLEKIGICLRKDYTYENYRNVRGVLSRNIVIWSRGGVEITYSEDITSKLRELATCDDLAKVTELGTGLRLLSGPGNEEYLKFISYFRELIRYRILR